jgi:Zn-dependent protease with chaperone function
VVALAGQAILHAAVAAFVVEALLRAWRVQDPGERLTLRWLVLLSPLVLTPLFAAAFPARSSETFALRSALFAGAHWNEFRLGPSGLATALAAWLSVIGVALYLRDAIPFLADRVSRQADDEAAPDHPAVARLHDVVRCLPSIPGQLAPECRVLERPEPVLLCSGVDRPRIIVSTGALDLLDDEALDRALQHEHAHLRARDPLIGWSLMAVRTLQAFNPVVQLAARQMIQDIEYRADLAVARSGGGPALARAIARLSGESAGTSDLVEPRGRLSPFHGALSRAQRRALGVRCERLLQAQPPAVSAAGKNLRLGLASLGLGVLLFYVV